MRITDKRFAEIQGHELAWWANNDVPIESLHERYTKVFAPYFFAFGVVADIGSGPAPYVLSRAVRWIRGWAIDPLIIEYTRLAKYRNAWLAPLGLATSTRTIGGGVCDGVFCLNTLDHVQDTYEMLSELARITKRGGRLFLLVDIDKEPDLMHPHKIKKDWLLRVLEGYFSTLYCKVEPSWKFTNDVLWYIGSRRLK